MTTVPIAARHMVTTIILLNRRLAFRTRSGVRLHPQPLRNIVEVDPVNRLLPVLDFSNFVCYLLLPLLKSVAVYWPMYGLRTTRETKPMRLLRLYSIDSQSIVGIWNAVVRQGTATFLTRRMSACAGSATKVDEIAVKFSGKHERRKNSPDNPVAARMWTETKVFGCGDKHLVGSLLQGLVNFQTGSQPFNFLE
ncbi:hypothetical protein MHU86_14094 [Fragilaria crotonensis]|nr:hypothetical protein MHU86_14094 [Fragilaria crotonensis]